MRKRTVNKCNFCTASSGLPATISTQFDKINPATKHNTNAMLISLSGTECAYVSELQTWVIPLGNPRSGFTKSRPRESTTNAQTHRLDKGRVRVGYTASKQSPSKAFYDDDDDDDIADRPG